MIRIRISDVIGMCALVIVILIALIIAGNLQTVNNTIAADLNNSEYNETASTLFTNTWTGLTLASIGIIIAAAAVGILALVVSALGGGMRPAEV